MKILRVRLKNLNSLLGEHELNFEAPPLAQAGLFAITGPTGAGKSTLLDAITLALYARASRYEGSKKGEGGASTDDVMSRKAAECEAEVSFEVQGTRYSARWYLYRARKKLSGAVQNAEHTLRDADGLELARGVKQVCEQVEKLTGLDYMRFLRSVLLAQGRFQEFLKAADKERAELLERLTGTEIYSELGQLAYEENKRREEELERLNLQADAIQTLSDEERARLEEEIAALALRSEEEKGRVELLRAAVERGGQLERVQKNSLTLREAEAALREKSESMSSSWNKLELHQKALLFSEPLQHLREARNQYGLLKKEQGTLTAEAEQKRAENLAALRALEVELRSELRLREESLRGAKERQTALQTERQEQRRWLEQNACDAGLDAAYDALISQLTAYEQAQASSAQTEREKTQVVKKLEAAETEQQQAAMQLKEKRSHMRSLDAELSLTQRALQELLAGRDEAALLGRDAALREQITLLQKAEAIQQLWRENEVQLSHQKSELVSVENIARTRQKEHDHAAAELKQIEQLLEAEQRAYELAKKVASLEQHRHALHPGEPCPLCGSTQHPFLQDGTDSAPHSELEQARLRCDVIQQKIVKKREYLVEIQARVARNLAALEYLQKDILQLEAKRPELQQKFAPLAAAFCPDFDTATPPGSLTLQSDITLRLQRLQHSQKEHVAQMQTLSVAREKIRLAEKSRAEEVTALALAEERGSTLQRNLTQLRSDLADCTQLHTTSVAEVARLQSETAAALAPFRIALDSFAAVPLRDTLRLRRKQYADAHERAQNILRDLAQTDTLLAQLQADLTHLQHELLRTSSTSPTLHTPALQRLRQLAAEAALAAHRQSDLLADITRRMQQSEKEGITLKNDLLARLRTSPFADDLALNDALLPADDADRLLRQREELQRQQQKLAGEITGAERQIQLLQEQGAPAPEALPDLLQKLRDATDSAAEQQRLLGSAQERLANDTLYRSKRAATHTRAAALLADLQPWHRLSALIGSADGATFKKFAQGLTLDLLLRRANRHLQRLQPRYLLRRIATTTATRSEMDLDILDGWQAAQPRPISSLSGGETFLLSLALALGLADLASRNTPIDTLFIDEGFGSLDPASLEQALSALEQLRTQGKTVGIVSHTDLVKERIPVQVRVTRDENGDGTVTLWG